jgi:hypothetical protein
MKKSAVIIILLGCIASGCVSQTTFKDEPRQSVHFASAEAAQTFYDAYLARYYHFSPSDKTKTNEVAIFIAMPYWHHTVQTENYHFNHAIQLADTNHDGIISDAEAQAYAVKDTPKLR